MPKLPTPDGIRWWHGGAPDFRVGDWILPPAVTGTPNSEDVLEMLSGMRDLGRVTRRDRVYITPDFWYAMHHACVYSPARTIAEWAVIGRRPKLGGWVYEVEPEGAIYRDSDLPLELSAACERARIVGVVVPTKAQIKRTERNRMKYEAKINAGGPAYSDPMTRAMDAKLAAWKAKARGRGRGRP